MANTLTPPSFFAEEMWHYEQSRADGIPQLPLVEPSSTHLYPLRPLVSTDGASLLTTMPPDSLIKTESATLAMPGILDGPVDQTQYEPVDEREWLHAAIDYDATSPDSLASTSPLTPTADFCVPFTEHILANGQYQNNSASASYFAQNQDIKPILQTPPLSSMPPGHYPQCDGAQMPQNVFNHNTHSTISPGTVTSLQALHHPQPMRTYSTQNAFKWADNTSSYGAADRTISVEYDESGYDNERVEAAEADQDTSSKSKKLSASNQALIRMRNEGISYKEIRRRLNLREAESTLRGRVRMLTKDKSERVRKPTWSPNDLRILRRAVNHFATHSRTRSGKIPWKMVSKWIQENGGSYAFGPATCAKKWDAINHQ
ncbi:hypothetical protein M433DRAFT_137840 [Acidomyces richmondensis BFW]|nr:hypothetical protein M433DRAFT_137840 [Acidomyces richmondensis BFW]